MADLETLRSAYRANSSQGDSVHLSEERWEKFAIDELTPEERETAVDHILTCAQCSDTCRALQIIRSEATAFDPGAPAPNKDQKKRFSSRKGLWGGMSFLALAAVVMMAIVLPTFNPEQPGIDSETQVLRSAEIPLPATPVSPVDQAVELKSRNELILKWTIDPPTHVLVQILDAAGELIWTSPETAATEVEIPLNVVIDPGRYYWRVILTEPTTGRISSELVSFELVDGGVTTSLP